MADWRAHLKGLGKGGGKGLGGAAYDGPVSAGVQVFEDRPPELTFKKEHCTSLDEGSPFSMVKYAFKKVSLPGTETWIYPKQSLTWNRSRQAWFFLNNYELTDEEGLKQEKAVSIPLRTWLADEAVQDTLNDESKIMHFHYKDGFGKYITEEEACAINDKFDINAPQAPKPKRVFSVPPDDSSAQASTSKQPEPASEPRAPATPPTTSASSKRRRFF